MADLLVGLRSRTAFVHAAFPATESEQRERRHDEPRRIGAARVARTALRALARHLRGGWRQRRRHERLALLDRDLGDVLGDEIRQRHLAAPHEREALRW